MTTVCESRVGGGTEYCNHPSDDLSGCIHNMLHNLTDYAGE